MASQGDRPLKGAWGITALIFLFMLSYPPTDYGFQGKDGQSVPEMDDERVQLISDRYIELFEKVTGNKFQKNNLDNPLKRIENAILRAL